MVEMSVTDSEFEKLSRERANLKDRILKWLEANPGGHSTQKIVEALGGSYTNIYLALSKLEKNGTLEVGYSGRTKVWRIKK